MNVETHSLDSLTSALDLDIYKMDIASRSVIFKKMGFWVMPLKMD